MKKIKWMSLLLIVVSCLAFTLSACGRGDDKGKLASTDSSKVLVAYFSATGNTEKVAGWIADYVEGTLYEIVPEIPYTPADLNYGDSTTRATAEQHDPDARPAIDGVVEDVGQYDVVYLGYPIWWGEAPKIIYTFLEAYDFSGKTIVPFCTSGSSGIGNSAVHLHPLAEEAAWLGGGSFYASSTQSTVRTWISSPAK